MTKKKDSTVRSIVPDHFTDITGWRNGDMELYYHAGNSEWIVRSALTDAMVRLGDDEMLSLAALMLAWGEES